MVVKPCPYTADLLVDVASQWVLSLELIQCLTPPRYRYLYHAPFVQGDLQGHALQLSTDRYALHGINLGLRRSGERLTHIKRVE